MKLFGPEAQMQLQADFAVGMVSDLPPLIAANDLPPVAQTACLESFFMNVRLMADFLVRRTDARDFGAVTLVPKWVPTPADAANRLKEKWWPLASQLVAHFSMDRIQADPSRPVDYAGSAEDLEAMRADVLAVWGAWLEQRRAITDYKLS